MARAVKLFAGAAGLLATAAAYDLTLQDVQFSAGTLEPQNFDPGTKSYTVHVDHSDVDAIGVNPIINQDSYPDGDYPLMYIDGEQQPTSIGVRAQVELPSDRSGKDIEVKLCTPDNSFKCESYNFKIDQSLAAQSTALKSITVTTDDGSVDVDPRISQDADKYTALVLPETKKFKVKVECAEGCTTKIDSKTVKKGKDVQFNRETDHAKQVVQVDCEVDSDGNENKHTYVLTVRAKSADGEVPPPDSITIESSGAVCTYNKNDTTFHCPPPNEDAEGEETENKKVRLLGDFDEQFKYTIATESRSKEVRLLKGRPTIEFTPSNDLRVEGESGDDHKVWPLTFDGIGGRGPGWLGIFLATLLMLNITSLLSVLSLSNAFGVGSPLGASEIAATLLFLLQYFCFSDYIRGEDTVLSDLCWKLKWVTIYWPLPGTDNPELTVGKLDNAYGCLFWSTILLLAAILGHLLLMGKFVLFERDYTYPNRLLMGHWESRILTFLCFPVSTASMYILWTGEAAVGWIVAAGVALVAYGVFAIVSFFAVHHFVNSGDVVWVWNSSVREQAELHDESGYWVDKQCDQLNTEPTTRSIFPWVFPWKWVSSVADIEEVTMRGSNSSPGLLGHDNAFEEGGNEPGYTLGKAPKTVEVWRTRHPGTCCPQQRLVAGLLRTQWLDVLFTYQGITKFHSSAVKSYGERLVMPLTVKTNQLTGQVAGGRLYFFFDGARMPFIRCMEILFRYTIGIMMGMTIASTRGWVDATSFFVIALIALLCLIYVAISFPYTRQIDNYLLDAVLFAVTCSAVGFGVHSAAGEKDWGKILVDVLLWITIIVCIVLALYSLVVTISVFAAVMCPPLEETKLLERLCNSEVTISDHSQGWSVDVPAYNKYACKDYKAQISGSTGDNIVVVYPTGEEPHLEFSVEDMIRACRSNNLRTPVACCYTPSHSDSLKYRHTNIYDRGAMHSQLANVLAEEGISHSSAVASNVARQLASVGNALAVVTIIPNKTGVPSVPA